MAKLVPIPHPPATTARRHFDEDMGRAHDLVARAQKLQTSGEPVRLCQDIRIAGIALGVGAMDAYLCDKYVDCLSAALQSYTQGSWSGSFPSTYAKERLPAGEVLDASRVRRPNWGIRMAARSIMERDNMLSISRVDRMFNGILPGGQKIWLDFIPKLIGLGYKRLTGPTTASQLANLTGERREKALKGAVSALKERLTSTIQIRHDWIHNCSRPKVAIDSYTHGQAIARLRDITVFVTETDDHIEKHRLA